MRAVDTARRCCSLRSQQPAAARGATPPLTPAAAGSLRSPPASVCPAQPGTQHIAAASGSTRHAIGSAEYRSAAVMPRAACGGSRGRPPPPAPRRHPCRLRRRRPTASTAGYGLGRRTPAGLRPSAIAPGPAAKRPRNRHPCRPRGTSAGLHAGLLGRYHRGVTVCGRWPKRATPARRLRRLAGLRPGVKGLRPNRSSRFGWPAGHPLTPARPPACPGYRLRAAGPRPQAAAPPHESAAKMAKLSGRASKAEPAVNCAARVVDNR